jgi:hypothetical protein
MLPWDYDGTQRQVTGVALIARGVINISAISARSLAVPNRRSRLIAGQKGGSNGS